MNQLSQLRMQQHELTMRQMVEQIHRGKLNLDQAAVQFEVNRKTVRHWVDKVEQEAETNREISSELPTQPPSRKKTTARHAPRETDDQSNELRARVHALNKNWK